MEELKKLFAQIPQNLLPIINACFAAIFLTLFLLMPYVGPISMASTIFGGQGMACTFGTIIGGLAIILGLVAVAVWPFIKGKMLPCAALTIIGLVAFMTIFLFHWNVITILWFILIVLPWAAFNILVDKK